MISTTDVFLRLVNHFNYKLATPLARYQLHLNRPDSTGKIWGWGTHHDFLRYRLRYTFTCITRSPVERHACMPILR